MTDNQNPYRSDYQRAAALFLHRNRSDVAGINAVLAEASEVDRTSALILAVMNVALVAPGSILATPEGIAGLQRIALDMAE